MPNYSTQNEAASSGGNFDRCQTSQAADLYCIPFLAMLLRLPLDRRTYAGNGAAREEQNIQTEKSDTICHKWRAAANLLDTPLN